MALKVSNEFIHPSPSPSHSCDLRTGAWMRVRVNKNTHTSKSFEKSNINSDKEHREDCEFFKEDQKQTNACTIYDLWFWQVQASVCESASRFRLSIKCWTLKLQVCMTLPIRFKVRNLHHYFYYPLLFSVYANIHNFKRMHNENRQLDVINDVDQMDAHGCGNSYSLKIYKQ